MLGIYVGYEIVDWVEMVHDGIQWRFRDNDDEFLGSRYIGIIIILIIML